MLDSLVDDEIRTEVLLRAVSYRWKKGKSRNIDHAPLYATPTDDEIAFTYLGGDQGRNPAGTAHDNSVTPESQASGFFRASSI
jgi:hypothetical protein